MNTRPHLCGRIAVISFLGLPLSAAFGQLQVAEDLLVNVNATTYSNGAGWGNSGSLGGTFNPVGTPTRLTGLQGNTAVYFDETDWFDGPVSTATLHGAQATYSIEVWAYQGYIRGEETLVSWGNRGADNNNVSFNYGSDNRWGAMGHWGGADLGWGPNDPNGTDGSRAPGTPIEGEWHHLVYTYDGLGTQRVYKDGQFVNSESGLNLDPFDSKPIRIGVQTETDGVVADGGRRFGGAIGAVRVHAGVLSDSQVMTNYALDAATYRPGGPVTQFLSMGPIHRYTFNNLSSSAAGTAIPDVVGGANGVLRGGGAALAGTTGVDLPGGDSHFQAYIDLPNGLASGKYNGGAGYTNVTYEAWLTVQSIQNWSRIFDFGSTNIGEVFDAGSDFGGSNALLMSSNIGTGADMRLERGGGGPGPGVRDTQGNLALNSQMHIVVTYDAANLEWKWYRNGILMEGFTSPDGGPATINDLNVWLGRSNWSGDANTDAIYDEFRIYDFALNESQVRGNYVAGPDVVNVPEPASATLAALGVAAILGRRRRRETPVS